MASLRVLDDDGNEVELDDTETAALLAAFDGLEPATVSACPDCRCRVVAAVAFVDLLEQGAPHPRSRELLELADDAPTLHLYVVDEPEECRHPRWRDPLADEWEDAVTDRGPDVRA